MVDIEKGPLVVQEDDFKEKRDEVLLDNRSIEDGIDRLIDKIDELIESIREITNR